MSFSARLFFVAVALLTAPIASRGQSCDLPTPEDVERVGGEILSGDLPEGTPALNMTVFTMSFTCLARVAFDKYTSASVVVNATDSNTADITVRQFQLQCTSDNKWGEDGASGFDGNVPLDPFNIETDFRCSECVEISSGASNYNADTNCRYCNPACGNDFCTDPFDTGCCSGFNSETGACVDCTTIDPNFAPNEEFTCVCNISCDPGYTRNTTECSCELTDGCEAAGQPCQNGGTCTSNLSADPFYSCECNSGYTGENCSTVVPTTIAITPPTSATTAEIPDCGEQCVEGRCISSTCCEECVEDFVLDADNCTCIEVTTTEPSRGTEPTDVCPETCRDCGGDDPTCCTVCLDGYVLRACECVEDEGEQSLAASQVAGIAIGLLLFILLILALAVLLAYVIYYYYDNKQKLKKGTALSPFSNGESHSNPLYLTPEEVEVED